MHPHLCLSQPSSPRPFQQIEILTVKGAHFYEMGMRAADLVVLGQARLGNRTVAEH
jgi:hypothetical protein